MRLLVTGAGATGGYFGGRLAQAGRDVVFLVRARRAALLREKGLEVVSPHGGFTLMPKLVSADAIDGPYDAILLAVKAYALDTALDHIAPAVGPQTAILPVLNGMKHIGAIAARFGAGSAMGCLCRIPARVDEHGRVVQLGAFHDLVYGELDGSLSRRAKTLDAFMQGAVFRAQLSQAIEQEMWEKWVMLATLAGITCSMRGSVGEIAGAPGGVEFVNAFLDEAAAVASASGHAPREAFLAQARAHLTAEGSPLTASMFRDLREGAPIEADQIIGDLLSRGRQAQVPVPLLALAYTHLAVYQNNLGDIRLNKGLGLRA